MIKLMVSLHLTESDTLYFVSIYDCFICFMLAIMVLVRFRSIKGSNNECPLIFDRSNNE